MTPAIINSRYELRGIVGRGGMGLVYRAHDRVIGRDVALKTLVEVNGTAAIQMFYKEWRALANIHHPNIIEIFDIGEFEDNGVTKPYFVMPLLPGVTLEQLIRSSKPALPAERLAEIVSQIAKGLQAIHDSGLVHRDVKPSNIFVMDLTSVKLIDFGIAHLIGGATVTGIKGTTSYMSPEQIRNQDCGPLSDLFSFGVVCYEALSGVRPFRGDTPEQVFAAILHGSPQPLYEVNPAVTQMVGRVIHKALAKDARHRFASVADFNDNFQRAVRGEMIPELDPARIQPRIQRALKAFEAGDHTMAMDILSDLEVAGYIDSAMAPLRTRITEAQRRQTVRDRLERARIAVEEEEFALAVQNAEAALAIDPANAEATRIREAAEAEIVSRHVDESLRSASRSIQRFAYDRAREAINAALKARPGDARAVALLADLEKCELAYQAARQEKEDLHKAARDNWANSEFRSAAAKLRRIRELDSRAPDTGTPSNGGSYTNFISLVESACAMIDNSAAEAKRAMAEGDFVRAAQVCRTCSEKYPEHPVPLGLRLLAESRAQAELIEKLADHMRSAVAERGIDQQIAGIAAAKAAWGADLPFDAWLRPLRERRMLVTTNEAKAREHEERGEMEEALERWEMILEIDPDNRSAPEQVARLAQLVERSSQTVAARPAYAAFATASAATGQALTTSPTLPEPPPVPAANVSVQPSPAAPAPSVSERIARQWTALRALAAELRGAAGRILPARFDVPSFNLALLNTFTGRLIAIGVAALLILSAALFTRTYRRPAPPPKTVAARKYHVTVRTATPGAGIRVEKLTGQDTLTAELAPARYKVEVFKPGYASRTDEVTVGAQDVNVTLPPLTPLPASLAIYANMPNAAVQIDDRPRETMDQPTIEKNDLSPGEHMLTVNGGGSELKLKFRTAEGAIPELLPGLQAKEAVVFAAVTLGNRVQIAANPAPAKLRLDENTASPSVTGTYEFEGLEQKAHFVVAGEGKDERPFIVESGDRPGISVAIFSDRNVGSLMIAAGMENFHVLVDGAPMNRKISNGSMFIGNLAPKKYTVRVVADGFEPSADKAVEIRKGGLARESFTLTAIPQVATLTIRGALPRTQVFVDDASAATADGEGNLRLDKVPKGPHQIELRNLPGYKSRRFTRDFPAGGSVTLTGEDVGLERNPGTLSASSNVEGAQAEFRCGNGPVQPRRRLPAAVACAESTVTVRVMAEGYTDRSEPVALKPGETVEHRFDLARAAVKEQRQKISCSPQDLKRPAWTGPEDSDWFAAGNNAELPCQGTAGIYAFTVRFPRVMSNVKWWLRTGNANIQFVLDKKSITVQSQKKQDISSFESENTYTFRLIKDQNRYQFDIKSKDGWEKLAAGSGDFQQAKVIFAKDARIRWLSFTER